MKKRLLIDTQILIWFYQDNPRLKGNIRDLIGDENNEIFISQVSFYEIAVKQSKGIMPDFLKPLEDIVEQVTQNEFQIWSIANTHLFSFYRIPYHKNHIDPFDRLILATALAEQVAIISADEKFKQYETIIELISA